MERKSPVYGGSSDVDVNVHVDTSSLAYAYACFMHASGQLTEDQFEEMLLKLDRLLESSRGSNYLSNEATTHQHQVHPQFNEKLRVFRPYKR